MLFYFLRKLISQIFNKKTITKLENLIKDLKKANKKLKEAIKMRPT